MVKALLLLSLSVNLLSLVCILRYGIATVRTEETLIPLAKRFYEHVYSK